jgi:hypothetical protein
VWTSRIAVLCYVAAVGLFGLAADTVWGALFPAAITARSTELLKDVRPSSSVVAAQAKSEDYAGIKSDRFMNPPPPPSESSRVEKQPLEQSGQGGPNAAYVLKGTLCHSNPVYSRAFIEITGVEEERAYKIGDVANGATIVAIGERTADCTRGATAFTLVVHFDDAAAPGQAQGATQEKGENSETKAGNPQAAEKREAREAKREAREEKSNQAQAENKGKADTWESLSPRVQERLQSLGPEERERFLRMTQPERMEFFRGRRAQDGNAARN